MNSEASDLVEPRMPDPPATDAQTPGVLLQQERMRRGLSIQQAAEGLHLDTWIIEAIESNRFLALGAPVYAKGYLRKFATLLGLAPDVVIARYEALTDTPAVPTPIPVITTTPPTRPKWPKVVAWCVVAGLALGIGWLVKDWVMPSRSSQASVEPPSAPVVPQQAAAETSGPVQTASPAPIAPATIVSAPEATRTTETVATPSQPARQTSVASEGAMTRLSLEFSESSWAEVYDANGQRLLYDIGQPGHVRNVSGQAPLSVVIGLASAVSAQVNDKPIVMPRRANKDSTRFSVDANGSVR